MFNFFKKLFGVDKTERIDTVEILVEEQAPSVPTVKKEKKPRAAPESPKEKLKAKRDAAKTEKPVPKKRGRPAKAK